MPHKVGPVFTERFPESESCSGKAKPLFVGGFWSLGVCWGIVGPRGEVMDVSQVTGVFIFCFSRGSREYYDIPQSQLFLIFVINVILYPTVA